QHYQNFVANAIYLSSGLPSLQFLLDHGVINYSDSSPSMYCLMTLLFFLNYKALPATSNGEELSIHEEQLRP
ncbi:MAG: hypothetical protein QXH93_04735, partial [Conexivisphaerales archaeon]